MRWGTVAGMARLLRVEYPGAIYHVTCRMIGDRRLDRSRLFVDEPDRERFLDRLADRVAQYDIRLYLFVCMTNHFHLVFETPEGNCSRFMQSLCTAYTVYYNLRHRRHGHVFDGRYKARLVEGDEYLLALSRYVHLNPVRVGSIRSKPLEERIGSLRSYRWSTYPGYIHRRQALGFVEYGPVLGQMRGKRRDWPGRYREFVEDGLAENDAEFEQALKASPRSIGSDGFRAWVDELYQELLEKHDAPEDVSFRRITEPLSSDTVLGILADVLGVEVAEFRQRRRDSLLRAIAARYLMRYAGRNQREVARELGAGSGSAMSKQLKRLSQSMSSDGKLRKTMAKAEQRLAAARVSKRDKPVNS